MKVRDLLCKSQGLTPRNPLAYEANNSDTCNHANMVVSFECSNHYMAAVIKKVENVWLFHIKGVYLQKNETR